jgi:hypothetical protein
LEALVTRVFAFVFTGLLLFSGAHGQISESTRRQESSDIAKLAGITRTDHSTIFFNGLTDFGYVRNGEIHSVVLDHGTRRSDSSYGLASAVSRDGSRLAYVAVVDHANHCQIVLRNIKTGDDKILAATEECPRVLSWSWDDSEIAYQAAKGVVAVSVADTTQRIVGALPLRINGKVPTDGWRLLAIDWLHHRPELVLDAETCVPTREPGTCVTQRQTLLFSSDDTRVLELGACAAVSPTDDRISYIADNKVMVVEADGSHRRAVTSIPSTSLLLPFIKEEAWSQIIWAPSGDRLWFDTIIDEGGNANIYLVDIKSGQRQRVLKHSTVAITAWRQF